MHFIKVQVKDSDTLQSEGSFELVSINSDKFLKLTHDTDNVLVGNCSGDAVELLEYTDSSNLKSTWEQCDGPGLYYTFQN